MRSAEYDIPSEKNRPRQFSIRFRFSFPHQTESAEEIYCVAAHLTHIRLHLNNNEKDKDTQRASEREGGSVHRV